MKGLINIKNQKSTHSTLLDNSFIDNYMPKANGEYVKIYVYLLSLIQRGSDNITISSIADKFENTDNDVIRALKYWEKSNLLSLESDRDENITSITLLDDNSPSDNDNINPDSTENIIAHEEIIELNENELVKENEKKDISYSRDELASLKKNENIEEALMIAQQYLGRLLNMKEVETICYFYDKLQFSTNLIDYLLEYCVTRKHTSLHYIKKVACNWAEKNIKNEDQAKEYVKKFDKVYNTVKKAFGLNDRDFGDAELKLISKWQYEYHYNSDIIKEACDKTLLKATNPSFPYANKILTDWFEKGVKTLEDVKNCDDEHARSTKKVKQTNNHHYSNNKFNDFPQRAFDSYAELERKLISQ
ncbi:DnaD and phage-associated domain-containing protein [Acetitomaculum ruminis DSM 5522]|uniref:DnaD and phage-associated domain-containing protein n=1 Tax=Acetitomaculum ruminis DSM 5522 TaxID=1120918 RepID=A0A1I0WZD4_9FIRM|nr:DnaD domain protein [Acetitomaculum ruminis]SFA93777.1 DnaD and phage-associated domain-containing protein [Acetitomaculum ruminis DSM 5522]